MTTKKYFIPWFVLGGLLSLLLACSEKPRPVRVLKTTRPPVVKPKPDIVKKECTQEYANGLGRDCETHCQGWRWNSSKHKCYKVGTDSEVQPGGDKPTNSDGPQIICENPNAPCPDNLDDINEGDDNATDDTSNTDEDSQTKPGDDATSGTDVVVVQDGNSDQELEDDSGTEEDGESGEGTDGGHNSGGTGGSDSNDGAQGQEADMVEHDEAAPKWAQSRVRMPQPSYEEIKWYKQVFKIEEADDGTPSPTQIEFYYGLRPYATADCINGHLNNGRLSRDLLYTPIAYDSSKATTNVVCHPMPALELGPIDQELYSKQVEAAVYPKDIQIGGEKTNYIYKVPSDATQLYTWTTGKQTYSNYETAKALVGIQEQITAKEIKNDDDQMPKISDILNGAASFVSTLLPTIIGFPTQTDVQQLEFCVDASSDAGCGDARQLGTMLKKGRGSVQNQIRLALLALQNRYKACYFKNGKAGEQAVIGLDADTTVDLEARAQQSAEAASSSTYLRSGARSQMKTKKSLWSRVLAFFDFRKKQNQSLSLASLATEFKPQQSDSDECPSGVHESSRHFATNDAFQPKLFEALEGEKVDSTRRLLYSQYSPVSLGLSFVPDANDDEPYNLENFKKLHNQAAMLQSRAFMKHISKPLSWRPMSFKLMNSGGTKEQDIGNGNKLDIVAYKEDGEHKELEWKANDRGDYIVKDNILHILNIKVLKQYKYFHIVLH